MENMTVSSEKLDTKALFDDEDIDTKTQSNSENMSNNTQSKSSEDIGDLEATSGSAKKSFKRFPPTKNVSSSPTKNDSSPTKNDSSPTKNESSPTKNDSSPTKNDSTSAKNESSPTKNESSPTKIESPLTKYKSSSTKNESSPKKESSTNADESSHVVESSDTDALAAPSTDETMLGYRNDDSMKMSNDGSTTGKWASKSSNEDTLSMSEGIKPVASKQDNSNREHSIENSINDDGVNQLAANPMLIQATIDIAKADFKVDSIDNKAAIQEQVANIENSMNKLISSRPSSAAGSGLSAVRSKTIDERP
jgi:hypothetical protein